MRVKNWQKFQHFKDRKPIWIKLYRDLLDDIEWYKLDGNSAKLLVMIWIIASENDGELPPLDNLAFRLRISEVELNSVVTKLGHWLEQVDIKLISSLYQDDIPHALAREREREREEKEEYKPEREESLRGDNAPLKRSRSAPKKNVCDREWMDSLKNNSAYAHINLENEHAKMVVWCQLKKKHPTRARFINWINRIDSPMQSTLSIGQSQIPNGYASAGAMRSLRIAEELRRQQSEEAHAI